MLSHSRRLCLLSLLSTLLTLSASGDDFYVVRIALPLQVPSETLPLDDPNTDFLSARKTVRVADSHDNDSPITCSVNSCLRRAPLRTPLGFSGAGERHPHHSDLNTPLLC